MSTTIRRREFLAASAAAAAATALPSLSAAQALETKKVKIAVGGRAALYYLSLMVADRNRFFEAEGLDVEIIDFAGGAKALQAVVGGSADVVSGAFEHTVNMLSKGQPMRAFVLAGRAPQIVLGVNRKTVPNYKSIQDLRGKTVGVTAPGSSTHILTNYVLAKGGLKPSDVSVVGVGATTTAVAAFRAGKIDAISNVDPVITILERTGELLVISDTRKVEEADQIFGGPMPAACLYAPATFVDRHPNTCQALANAMVRANKWVHRAGPSDVLKIVPESYLLGDAAVYLDAFLKAKAATSRDGLFPDKGAETALRALASVDAKLAQAKLDLKSVYTNEFARKANLKYPQG